MGAITSDSGLPSGAVIFGSDSSSTPGASAYPLERLRGGYVTLEDFGAIGDGTTHPLSGIYGSLGAAQVDYPLATSLTQEIDYCALMKAMASETYTNESHSLHKSGPTIWLKNGSTYIMGQTVNIKKQVKIFGASAGMPWDGGAAFKFPADVSGFIIHRYNTIDDGIESPTTTEASGTVLYGFRVLGTMGTDPTAHGVWMRTRAHCLLYIEGFTGNGYHIVATAGGGGSAEGNANNFRIDGGRVQGCGEHGIYISGADCNAGLVIGLDISECGKSGVYENSFLGNTYLAMHFAANGAKGLVYYSGNRYYCKDESLAGTTTPGTDSAVWGLIGAGSSSSIFVTWASGATYYITNVIRADNPNARNLFLGTYVEGEQSPINIVYPTLMVGGLAAEDQFLSDDSAQGVIGSNPLGMQFGRTTVKSNDVTITLGKEPGIDEIIGWDHVDEATPWRLCYESGNLILRNNGLESRTAFSISSTDTTKQFGTGSAVPYVFTTVQLGIGQGLGERIIQRENTSGFPSSGVFAQGQIGLYLEPAAGGSIGWVCTTAGTAGSGAVFKNWGAIDP